MQIRTAVDDFLLYLEVEQNYSKHTLYGYEYDLVVFLTFLQRHKRSTELNELDPSVVRRYIQDQVIHQKIKPRTTQRRISSLKSFSKYCLKERLMNADFMAGIKAPKSDSKLPVYMNVQELRKLFDLLEREQHSLALRNENMFKLLATSGMRRQELVDLTWEQLDLNNETIRVYGKGKKERLLPLHQMVVPLLKAYKASLKDYQTHPSEPIFYNKNGKALDPRGLYKIFKTLLEKAGLPPHRFSLHDLRHTFATLMLQSVRMDLGDGSTGTPKDKVDLRTLQELLGHESLATTQVFSHFV